MSSMVSSETDVVSEYLVRRDSTSATIPIGFSAWSRICGSHLGARDVGYPLPWMLMCWQTPDDSHGQRQRTWSVLGAWSTGMEHGQWPSPSTLGNSPANGEVVI